MPKRIGEEWRGLGVKFMTGILELSRVDVGRVASNESGVSSLAPTKILGRSSVLHTCPGVGRGKSKSKSKHTKAEMKHETVESSQRRGRERKLAMCIHL